MNEFEAHESSYDHQHKKVGFYSIVRYRFSESRARIISSFKLGFPSLGLAHQAELQGSYPST